MNSLRILFIGNSATYFHDMPKTFEKMARSMGKQVQVEQATQGGYMLSQHAEAQSDWGKQVRDKIAQGFDIVFLQDHCNCISSPETQEECRKACRTLDALNRAAGGKTYLYVRPPYGYAAYDHSPQEQVSALDQLFTQIGQELQAPCAWANRAYAQVLRQHPEIDLYWEDHGHASEAGSYLIACVCLIAVYGALPEAMDSAALPLQTARALQQAAKEIMQV